MKKFIRSCWFNMDTACVEVTLTDGSVVGIDCIAVEDEYADNINGFRSYFSYAFHLIKCMKYPNGINRKNF